MFARVTAAHIRHEAFENAVALFRDTVVPSVRPLSGYRGVVALGHRSDMRVMAVTLWATEEDLRASGMNQDVLNSVADFGPFVEGNFSRDQYEVVTDTWDMAASAPRLASLYARVSTMLLQQANWVEGVALVREIAGRPAGEPAEYLGSLALADPATGKALVLEMWDSRAALMEYQLGVHLHDRMARDRNVLAGPPAHDMYRVVVLDAPRDA